MGIVKEFLAAIIWALRAQLYQIHVEITEQHQNCLLGELRIEQKGFSCELEIESYVRRQDLQWNFTGILHFVIWMGVPFQAVISWKAKFQMEGEQGRALTREILDAVANVLDDRRTVGAPKRGKVVRFPVPVIIVSGAH